MTDAVAIALITGGFGTVTATITTIGTLIARKARDAARAAAKISTEVRGQAKENWNISQANHAALTKVVEQTNGQMTKLQEAWEAEAKRRETAAWREAYELGRQAEMTKNRRSTDPLVAEVEPVNDEKPKE